MTDSPWILRALLGAALGAALASWLIPTWVPAMAGSLAGAEPRGFWYLSRASGLVAYVLVWLSVVLGLLQSTGLAQTALRGPAFVAAHRQTAFAGLAFAALHAAVLVGDRQVGGNVSALAVPFALTRHAPGWVGLGQIALYAAGVIAASFRLRKWIGARTWRALHFASFTVFALVVCHAIMAGSDAAEPWAIALYASTGGIVVLLTAVRFSRRSAAPRARAPRSAV